MKQKGIITDNGCPIAALDVENGLKEAYDNYVKGTSEDYEFVSSGSGENEVYEYEYAVFFDTKSLTSFTLACKTFKTRPYVQELTRNA